MRGPRAQRFTLVELMIVVAIIALLAAIAIPLVNDYQDKAKRAEAQPNARAIRDASIGYYQTSGDISLLDHPRDRTTVDKNAIAWTTPTAPSASWIASGFVPDGKVRCAYWGGASTGGTPPLPTYWGEGHCDVDGDGFRFVVSDSESPTSAQIFYGCQPSPTGSSECWGYGRPDPNCECQ